MFRERMAVEAHDRTALDLHPRRAHAREALANLVGGHLGPRVLEIGGFGEKPRVIAIGRCARRNVRPSRRTRSRWPRNAARPILANRIRYVVHCRPAPL